MCGIAGILLREVGNHDAATNAVEQMTDQLSHRGPDSSGIWSDDDCGVILGHRRLAVIDLSNGGMQPMHTDRCDIVYNGEIYNFRDLRKRLLQLGCQFKTDSDTEVVVKAYETWGADCVHEFVGMFSFAIWDRSRKQLFAAVDRCGEKPFYYAELPGTGFAFASEIGPLASLCGVDTSIDREAVSLYLQFLSIPAPRSIYVGIKKLCPAHTLRRDVSGKVEVSRYWDPVEIAARPKNELSECDALEKLDSLMRQAIADQMISDVPLGAFLSGGYDSSLIVSYMTELTNQTVKTYTIGFNDAALDESRFAQSVADHLGTEHTCRVLSRKQLLDLVPNIPTIFGEPFADPSALPTQLLSSVAREEVTVCLSGDGGDELFGGYRHYATMEKIQKLRRLPKIPELILSHANRSFPSNTARVLKYFGLSTYEQYLELKRRTPLWDIRTIVGTCGRREDSAKAFAELQHLQVREMAMMADFVGDFPADILVKVDRSAMSASLETRAPILDHRVAEFALQMPVDWKVQRSLWKKLAHQRIDKRLLDRPKAGFNVPLDDWLQNELKEMMQDLLLTGEISPALAPNAARIVSRYVKEFLSGKGAHSLRIWALLVLALWSRNQRVNHIQWS